MKITLVNGDDWEGIYIDNELMMENHSLHLGRTLKLIQDKMSGRMDKIEHLSEIVADGEWLEERGCLPKKLDEVKVSDNY